MRELATFASLIKIINVDDFANDMYESSYYYQPFYKRAMNILFNMQNEIIEFSIFAMYLKFAKEKEEPQKFNLANKITSNRSIYPITREFMGMLDQLGFIGQKKNLLMYEWKKKNDSKKFGSY